MAFSKAKAQEGDNEAQVINEQIALSQEVENLLENYEDDSPENAGDNLNGAEDASMKAVSEEPPRTDPIPGEPVHSRMLPTETLRTESASELIWSRASTAWICQR
eukprot:3602249-Amphidinium_carterae.1